MNEEIKKEEVDIKIEAEAVEKTEASATTVEKVFATIDDFMKIEIKVGTVLSVKAVEGADKLYILSVDFNEENPRQILSGIREYAQPEDLQGKQFPFVTNLAPRMLRGHESQGMILAGSDVNGLALFNPSKPLINGTRLK